LFTSREGLGNWELGIGNWEGGNNKQEKEKLELLTNLTKNEKVASLVEL